MTVNMGIVWLIILMCFSFFAVCVCLWRASENRLAAMSVVDLKTKLQTVDEDRKAIKERMDEVEDSLNFIRNEVVRLSESFNGMRSGSAKDAVSALDVVKELESRCRECESQWQAIAERLDAQGARVLELEHRVSVAKPVVPE